MSVTATQLEVPLSFTGTFRHSDNKNISRINVDSVNTLSEGSKTITENNQKHLNNQSLPINFFHSPAEYNRMLIKCVPPETGNVVERKMGVLKNLEFMN